MEKEEYGMITLGVGRIALSFTFIWAFFDKLLGLGFPSTPEVAIVNGGSPTQYYLSELAQGFMKDVWAVLAGNSIVDFLLMAGLLLVGIGMLAGVASKLSTVGFCLMMVLMYLLVVPPVDNPLLSHHVIYLIFALAIYWLGGYQKLSLHDRWVELPIVKDHPFLW